MQEKKNEEENQTKTRKFFKKHIGLGGVSPVLEPYKAEIVDLDDLQPLGYRVKDELDPILRQLDGEVVGQGVPVTVRYLHSLVEKKSCIKSFKMIFPEY